MASTKKQARRAPRAADRAKMSEIVDRLKTLYPEAICALEWGGEDGWRLLVMGRLSAQCTDARVNVVCRELFARFPTAADMAEADIAELESYEERQMFLEDMGLSESGVSRLIKAAYKLLNLETFFTTGPDESRAWTYVKGAKAPQTAGVIHTDFEKGFIRAEVIKYEDYVTLGSEKACRDVGKIGIEGKEYVVQDGDIMHFLFNV